MKKPLKILLFLSVYLIAFCFAGGIREAKASEIIANGYACDGLYWFLRDDGGLVFENSFSTPIPDPAESQDNWLAYAKRIKTVTIGQGVTGIGDNALRDCTSLTTVNFPDSGFLTIGSNVFNGCSRLKSLVLPTTINSVSSSAFDGMVSSLKLRVSNVTCNTAKALTSAGYSFYRNSNYNYALQCSSRGVVSLVKYKGTATSVTLPSYIKSIAAYAFQGTSVTSLTLTNNITSISGRAFEGAEENLKVFVPSGSPNGNAAKVATAVSGSSVYYVSDSPDLALRCSGEGVVTLRQYTGSATAVTVPDYVSALAEGCFSGNTTVQSITLTGVTTMGRRTFNGCTALETAVLNEGLTEINTQAFNGCTSLRSVLVPDSVNSISDSAFDNAYNVCLSIGCTSYAKDWAIGKNYIQDQEDTMGSGRRYRLIHVPVEDSAVAPNCLETRLTEGSHCSRCETVLVAQETVPALGHDWNEPTYEWNDAHTQITATRTCNHDASHPETQTVNATAEVTIAATCTEMGQTTYTSAAFSNPAFTVQAVTLTDVPALGHDWDAPTYDWNADHSAITATRVCTRDSGHKEEETKPATAEVTTAATCTEMGQTTYTSAAFSNPAFTVQTATLMDVPALGHDWKEPAYTWNSDHSQVTATHVCNRDQSHTESETKTATSQVTLAATCTEMGETTYTSASFENAAFSVQTVTLTDVPALGHDWGAPTYTWAADDNEVTAVRVCTRNATHNETETKAATRALITAPTEITAGSYQIRSEEFENLAFVAQEKVGNIPALNTMTVLRLPSFLRMIEAEAFANVAAEAIIVPNTVTTIEPKAFINCQNLIYIRIPSGVTIPADAFDGSPLVMVDQE